MTGLVVQDSVSQISGNTLLPLSMNTFTNIIMHKKRSTVQRSELYIHIVKAAANGVSVCKCEVAMLRMEMVHSPQFGELISCTEVYPNIRKKVHPTSPLSRWHRDKVVPF